VEKSMIIRNLIEMDLLAKTIASFLRPGMILGLTGDLGSGKTTFTQFLAKHMGILDHVNSPTFTILKIYQGKIPLYHMDVYRLETIGYDYELDDFLFGDGVSVIEWYPYIKVMLPEDILSLDIKVVSENNREIKIKGSGVYEQIVHQIDC